jgi:hypothetical protein
VDGGAFHEELAALEAIAMHPEHPLVLNEVVVAPGKAHLLQEEKGDEEVVAESRPMNE